MLQPRRGPALRICEDERRDELADLRGRGAGRRDPDRAHGRISRPLPRARGRAVADRRRRPRGPQDRRALARVDGAASVEEVVLATNPTTTGRRRPSTSPSCCAGRRPSPASPRACRSAPTSSTPTRSRSVARSPAACRSTARREVSSAPGPTAPERRLGAGARPVERDGGCGRGAPAWSRGRGGGARAA